MIRYRSSTIANKILLGFLPLIALLGIIPYFAFKSLEEVREINQRIVQEDMWVIGSTDVLLNELLLQQAFGQHYLISRTDRIRQQFIEHATKFDTVVARMKEVQVDQVFSTKINKIADHHQRYNTLYSTYYQTAETLFPVNTAVQNKKITAEFDALSRLINEIKQATFKRQETRVREIALISHKALKIMAGLFIIGILVGIVSVFLGFRYILRSIQQLIKATEEIARGNFDFVPQIKGAGELQRLAESFSEMGKRLATLEKRNLETNPLTRMPGGAAIETVLKTRLEQRLPAAFCLVDIDNFKAFNDRYGYATGNSVIKETGKIIREATSKFGTDNDFVGHIGGDDFVFLTVPERYEAICREIIKRFDARIPEFYTIEDAERGFIESKSRQGEKMRFPIMTVSMAVVTNADKKECNHIRFGEIAAELKSKAKTLSGSVFVVDQRRDE